MSLVLAEREQGSKSISSLTINVASTTASKVEGTLEALEILLKAVSNRYRDIDTKQSEARSALEKQLRDEIALYPTALRLALADKDGNQFLNTGNAIGEVAGLQNLSDRDFYKRAKLGERGLMFQGPIQAKLDKTWSILMAYPIVGSNGSFQGMVVAVLPLSRLSEGLDNLSLGFDGVVTLRTEELKQVARFPEAENPDLGIGNSMVSAEFERIVRSKSVDKYTLFEATSPVDGVRRIYTARKLDGYPFWLSVGQSVEQYKASWISSAIAALIISTAASLLIFWGARRLDKSQLELEWQVTERTANLAQMTEEAQRAKLRLSNATEAASIGLWVWSLSDNKLIWDNRMFKLYGIEHLATLEPIGFETWSERVHPEDLALAELKLEKLLQSGGTYDAQFRVIHPNGATVYIKASAFLEKNEKGEVTHVVGLNVDVSTLKRYQQALEEAQRMAKLGNWWFDGPTQIFGVSKEAARMFDLPDPNNVQFDQWFARVHPEDKPAVQRAWEATLNGAPYDVTYRINARGREVWVHVLANLEVDENRSLLRAVGTVQDVTDITRYQDQLREAREAADKASAAKSAFLANMSHEMRTPLNALLGLNRVLGDSELNEQQRITLNKMNVAGRSLLGVINDVLDLSKIESGELALSREPFYLSTLLKEVEDFSELVAKEKGLTISVDASQVSDEGFVGDAQRIRQMLINFTSNAIKFTEEGEINVRVKPIETAHSEELATKPRFRFEVVDTGIGVNKELQQKLFRPFSQADSNTFRKYGGTGLGLSIVKSMAEAMGGSVGFSSVPGIGSTFWFELPLDLASSEENLHIPTNSLSTLIVTADDTLSNELQSQSRLLGWQSWRVSSCEDLRAFVLKHNASKRMIDCVLIDYSLEGGEAIHTVQSLKEDLPDSKVPASLIVYPSEVDSVSRGGGIDSLIVRPVNPSKLFNEVNKAVLSHRPSDYSYVVKRSKLSHTGLHWLKDLNILLVDDVELNLEVAGYVLSQQGANVVSVLSGQQAIECLENNREEFDVVLMDVQMPLMDGNDATRKIKAIPQFSNLPVIALTAGATESERKLSIEAGMVSYLTKPLDADEAIRVIRGVVESHRGGPIELEDQKGLSQQSV